MQFYLAYKETMAFQQVSFICCFLFLLNLSTSGQAYNTPCSATASFCYGRYQMVQGQSHGCWKQQPHSGIFCAILCHWWECCYRTANFPHSSSIFLADAYEVGWEFCLHKVNCFSPRYKSTDLFAQPCFLFQVLRELPGKTEPILHLSETFTIKENQEKLGKFIEQFIWQSAY